MKSDLQGKLEEPKESSLKKKGDKNKNKKESIKCTVISDEIMPKKKKVKICDEKTEDKVKNKRDTKAASTKHVELQCDKETNFKTSKTPKVKNIDDMFDSVTENIKCKVDYKIQKMKKKLETESKVNKRKKKEEDKKNEDDTMNLEFKEAKQKPILDLPLEEATSKENSQQQDLMSLKTIANTEHEFAEKTDTHAAEIDPQKYLKIKPKYLKTQMPDLDTGGEDVLDDSEQEEETHRIMSEAFADDDVVEEFRKEKEEEVCNERISNNFKQLLRNYLWFV